MAGAADVLKLAIVSTHPVQYYAPVFRGLANTPQLDVRVFYTWSQTAAGGVHDPGFGQAIRWDVPLLDGYNHEFVANVATKPGSNHFWGVRVPTLVPRIREWGADAVLVYGWNLAAHLAAMRAFKGKTPVFFRGDSTLLDPQAPWRAALRRQVLRGVYRHVDVAIAVGANSRDYFEWCGLSPEDIEFAPHSVDTARFGADEAAQERAAARTREELRIMPDALVYAFAGKFLAKKDPLLLIDAFLAARGQAHLVMFGSGPLARQIQDRVALSSRVHVLPFQNQSSMPAAYRVGDVFVLPSRGPGETWGLALNEAMACGRPVIASSRVGGARDLIVESRTGWTFPAGDGASLTQLFDSIGELPRDRLRIMGGLARAHAQRYSTETCVARMAEILLRRASPRARPRSAVARARSRRLRT